jgi:hypothetical protein
LDTIASVADPQHAVARAHRLPWQVRACATTASALQAVPSRFVVGIAKPLAGKRYTDRRGGAKAQEETRMGSTSGVVLITGASSGIGRETANYLAGKGFRVYGTSCRAVSEDLA